MRKIIVIQSKSDFFLSSFFCEKRKGIADAWMEKKGRKEEREKEKRRYVFGFHK